MASDLPLENEMKAQLVAYFREIGCATLSVHGHAEQQPGWPDIYTTFPTSRDRDLQLGAPQSTWIELKRDGNTPSTSQKSIISKLVRHNTAGYFLDISASFSRPRFTLWTAYSAVRSLKRELGCTYIEKQGKRVVHRSENLVKWLRYMALMSIEDENKAWHVEAQRSAKIT